MGRDGSIVRGEGWFRVVVGSAGLRIRLVLWAAPRGYTALPQLSLH